MARYPFRCKACGKEQDHWIPMSEWCARGIASAPPCEVAKCGGSLIKLVVQVYEHSENTWRPYWSRNLAADGQEQTLITSRKMYHELMHERGLAPLEAGQEKDAARARNRARDEVRAAASEMADSALSEITSLSSESLRERAGEVREAFQKEEAAA